jgi:ABC-type transport system substrate-binding protein
MAGFPYNMLFDQTPTEAELGPWFKYDQAQAKQLLQAAGAQDLQFSFMDTKAYGDRSSANALLIDMFREVGITMEYRDVQAQEFNTQYYARGWLKSDVDAILNFTTAAPTVNGYWWDNLNSASAKNYLGITDPEIDQWTNQIRSELDPEARKDAMRKVWDKVLGTPLRIEGTYVTAYGATVMQPWVRYLRWNGPWIAAHAFYDWGWDYHKYWIDK